MSREIVVRNPGLLSLVQDRGRRGFQRFGVSVSGAVDQDALFVGNLLVGNDPGAAVIEVTFGGAEFEFIHDSVVAITGGDLQPTLDGTRLSMWESFLVAAGSVLRFTAPVTGMRAYVAVDGGIDTSPALGSRSTHISSSLGGLAGGPLRQGDTLPLAVSNESATAGAKLPEDLQTAWGKEIVARVIIGPQQKQFSATGTETFFNSAYAVTESSDRQGLRLEGPTIESESGRYDIVSDAVVPGSIQVPGDGKPIVLLADSQTTGGYAKIGVVASVDLPLLAQATPGTVVRFKEVSVTEAQKLLRERRKALSEAKLLHQLNTTRKEFSVNGAILDVSVTCRPNGILQPGGSLASVAIDGIKSTVRIEEID